MEETLADVLLKCAALESEPRQFEGALPPNTNLALPSDEDLRFLETDLGQREVSIAVLRRAHDAHPVSGSGNSCLPKQRVINAAAEDVLIASDALLTSDGGESRTSLGNAALAVTDGGASYKTTLQSTPVSSLPPGSLLRHLVALRKKRYLSEREPAPGGSQAPGAVLTDVRIPSSVGPYSIPPKFITSTPQPTAESEYTSHIRRGEAIRYPLTDLPLNQFYNNDNTASETKAGCLQKSSACNSSFRIDENSPSVTSVSADELHTSRSYDPNTYRSPPKQVFDAGVQKCSVFELEQRDDSSLNRYGANANDTETSTPRDAGSPSCVRDDGPVTHRDAGSPSCVRDDERPLSTASKPFEQLLTEKLKDKSFSLADNDSFLPVKKFLKKGSGISRFTSQNRERNFPGPTFNARSDLPNITKPKFRFLKKGAGTRRYNIVSVKLKKSSKSSNLSSKIDRLELDGASHRTAGGVSSEDVRKNEFEGINNGDEFSFMSPIRKVSFHRESEELKAFEALEELAEHSSFCSDASTVHSLLRHGLECSPASTPDASPSMRQLRHRTGWYGVDLRRRASCTDSPHPLRGDGDNRANFPDRATDSESGDAKVKKSVQFCRQGARVLEFYPDDDAVGETQSLSDASDLFNVSDLEALNQTSKEGKTPTDLTVPDVAYSETRDLGTPVEVLGKVQSSAPHEFLQFSPPRVPPDAASYAVWEAFGKKSKSAARLEIQRKSSRNTMANHAKLDDVQHDTKADLQPNFRGDPRAKHQYKEKEEELEAHKVLLVSKVHELEKEIRTFQNENSVLAKLRNAFWREKDLFEREKRLFEETIERERRNVEDQFEKERNRLWREKCLLESNKQFKSPKDNVLEVINLKEETLTLKNELERRDSMNNFNVNKLKARIKELTLEKKDLESKVQKIPLLEKENMALKHQVDRLKLTSRLAYDKPAPKSKPKVCETSSCPTAGEMVDLPTGQTIAVKPISNNQRYKGTTSNSSKQKSIYSINDNILSNDNCTMQKSVSFDLNEAVGNSIDTYMGNFSTASTPSSGIVHSAGAFNFSAENSSDGSKVITYANGNKKTILASGCVVHEYYNGDRKEVSRDRVVYFYSDSGIRQTTFLDGSEELLFPSGQTEMKRADTSIEVVFPDRSKTVKLPDGTEVHHKTDGTVITSAPSGDKVFEFPSGQREVHGQGFKRREYPDGTAKVLYEDGSSETTYPNGRIRVKDKLGSVVSDTKLGLDLIQRP